MEGTARHLRRDRGAMGMDRTDAELISAGLAAAASTFDDPARRPYRPLWSARRARGRARLNPTDLTPDTEAR